MISIYTDEVDYSILEKLQKEYFTNGVIMINTKGENKIIDSKLHLGTWAGPQANLFNLTHEMGHFIEIDKRRCGHPSWGLTVGKWVTIAGQLVRKEMLTPKAIEREIRTFAIQTVLMQHFNIPNKIDVNNNEVELFTYMAGLCKYIDGIYYYHPKDDSLTWNQCEAIAVKTIATLIEETVKEWNIDRVNSEWKEKIKVLKRKKLS